MKETYILYTLSLSLDGEYTNILYEGTEEECKRFLGSLSKGKTDQGLTDIIMDNRVIGHSYGCYFFIQKCYELI